ncbi:hypothetical protein [Mycobacteroides saopaulense]|uniref:hypothetical protein n=1 Tax=Mycobacteroides saopaulense TaxID=1578165 RepID=UPI0010421DAD
MNGGQFVPPSMPGQLPDYQGGNQPPLNQDGSASIYNTGTQGAPQQAPGQQGGQQPQQGWDQPAHGSQPPNYSTAPGYTQGPGQSNPDYQQPQQGNQSQPQQGTQNQQPSQAPSQTQQPDQNDQQDQQRQQQCEQQAEDYGILQEFVSLIKSGVGGAGSVFKKPDRGWQPAFECSCAPNQKMPQSKEGICDWPVIGSLACKTVTGTAQPDPKQMTPTQTPTPTETPKQPEQKDCPPPGPVTITDSGGNPYTLVATQRNNAQAIINAGRQFLPADSRQGRGITIGLVTALAESNLVNVGSSKFPESLASADKDPTAPHWDEQVGANVGSDHNSIGIVQQQVGIWGDDVSNMMSVQEAMKRFFLGYQHPEGGSNPGMVEAGRIGSTGDNFPGQSLDYGDPKWDMHTIAQQVQNSGPGDPDDATYGALNRTPSGQPDPGLHNYGPWEKGGSELYDLLKNC